MNSNIRTFIIWIVSVLIVLTSVSTIPPKSTRSVKGPDIGHLDTEYLSMKGMDYVVLHYINGGVEMRNLTLDSLQVEYYKNRMYE